MKCSIGRRPGLSRQPPLGEPLLRSKIGWITSLYGALDLIHRGGVMRARLPVRSYALIVALGLGGCGGAPSSPPPEPSPEPDAAPAAVEPDRAVTDTPDPAPAPRAPSNVENNQDYEISDRDCRTLAAAYAEAWRLDEIEKIPAGMSPSQRDEVDSDLATSSTEMREQYLGQCQNTVGTAYPYDNLKCAMKAKSMQRFDDCMAGKL